MKLELKVSDKSNVGCRYCHEDSTFVGDIAHFEQAFIDTLEAGTELTITGKNIFENPYLEDFLKICQQREMSCSIIIEQAALNDYGWVVEKWVDKGLIGGIAITFNGHSDELLEMLNTSSLKNHKENVVIQVVYGMQSYTSLKSFFNQDLKLRILGCQEFEQAKDCNVKMTYKQELFYTNLPNMMRAFKEVSFDSLAIKQLDIKRLFISDEWETGQLEENEVTLYIDMVKGEFASSAQSEKRYPILSDIEEMVKKVRSEEEMN